MGSGDEIGHGTSVSGIIASRRDGCKGLASDSTLHIYKVQGAHDASVDNSRFAIALSELSNVNVVNLSHGDVRTNLTIEYLVSEIVSRGVTVVASAGNHGVHLSPARLHSVISVGSHNAVGGITRRSAQGWSPTRSVKPDLVAPGTRVLTINPQTGRCSKYSGTSYSTPFVTAVIAQLGEATYPHRLNPGEVRQILYNSATRLKSHHILQQGFGAINLTAALAYLPRHYPHLSAHPAQFDLVNDCDYLKPFCEYQFSIDTPIFRFNLTLIDSRYASTRITHSKWLGHPIFDILTNTPRQLDAFGGELEVMIRQTAHAVEPHEFSGDLIIYSQDSSITVRFHLRAT